jgi:hypothetical protein
MNLSSLSSLGGAIYSNAIDANSTITSTTFYRVKVGFIGGAIYLECKGVSVRDCCGNGCWSGRDRSFAYTSGSGEHSFTETMIVGGSSEGDGTVYCDDCSRALFSNVNVTACSTSGGGSGIQIAWTEFVCLYFGGMKLAGLSVIDSSSISSKSTVSYSQFYQNEVGLSGSALYGRGNGFVVANTQFRSNTRDFYMAVSGSSTSVRSIFVFKDCVFSLPYSSTTHVSYLGLNLYNTTTASLAISFDNTRFCPTSVPPSSVRASTSRSRSVSRTRSVARTRS